MRRSASRGRMLAALVLVAESAALFIAYYTLGLRDRVLGLEQSPLVQAVAARVLVTVRGIVPAWINRSLSTFTSAIGLTQGLHELANAESSLGSSVGFSSLGGAIVAPAYFAVRRMLRSPAQLVQPGVRRAAHGRIRPAMAPALARPVPPTGTVPRAS